MSDERERIEFGTLGEQHQAGIAATKGKLTSRWADQSAKLICIEGNIGAGKSTLTEALANKLGAVAMFEPVKENPYLDRFYSNPRRYALEMQFWLMSRRFEMHEKAIRHIWKTAQSVIMDRSIYGDWVFAKRNYLDGNIDEAGYASYLHHRKTMDQYLLTPHVMLWLNAHPQTCQDRIATRGRECEALVPIDYLKGLHALHIELMNDMRERGARVIALDWDTPYQDIGEVAMRIFPNGQQERTL